MKIEFTEELKQKIIDDYATGEYTQRSLQKKYNIGYHYIQKALGNKVKQTNEYHKEYDKRKRLEARKNKEYIKILEKENERLKQELDTLKLKLSICD